MMLGVPAGVMLYCRRCDAEVPHREHRFSRFLLEALVCSAGHLMHPLQVMITMAYDDTFSPVVLMLPRRSWNAAYVQQRELLQSKYLRSKKG